MRNDLCILRHKNHDFCSALFTFLTALQIPEQIRDNTLSSYLLAETLQSLNDSFVRTTVLGLRYFEHLY